MEDFISIIIFISVLQFMLLNGKSYDLKCPSNISWKIRATFKCNSTLKYYCLYNNVEEKYFEGCTGPDWDRKGSKRIFSGSFTRADCKHKRFQPFIFWTNGSLSDCVFAKSKCNEEGQLVNKDESANEDRTCRCGYEKNYTFIKTPRNICLCIPTREDCACYHTTYSTNSSISADNCCTQSGNKENKNRTDIIIYDKSLDGKTEKEQIPLQPATFNSNMFKWKYKTDNILLVYFCFLTIFVAGGFFIAVLFHEWTNDKLQLIETYFRRNNTAGGQRLEEEGNQQIENSKLTTDEVNYLRMVHLLVRVACPVVRVFFNNEIKPDQLRKILDKKKQEMVKQYRKKDTIINDSQWNLLFGPDIGRSVTSDDLDIRLIISLLSTLANIEVGDLYPVYSDLRTSAMLSRIKFLSNETLRNFDGKLAGYTYNKYWDDIGQAVLKLGSCLKLDIRNEQEKTRMIDRLLVLSPITVDDKILRIFIYLSDIYPVFLLRQVISEYCALNVLTVEDILRINKHELYHKRINTESCCICHTGSPIFYKCIPEKQWKSFYETNKGHSLHVCPFDQIQCIYHFVPKRIDTLDISISKALILNIPGILKYMVQRLCISGFDQFLTHYQHVIYHSMEEIMCCKCSDVPAEKTIINKGEWNKLFKKAENVSCKFGIKTCCCQYLVRNGIKFTDIEDVLLIKIFNVAGPIAVLNKVEQDPFLYFLNWTVDDKPLQTALKNLLNIIDDKMLNVSIPSSVPSKSRETEANQSDVRRWIARHLQKKKATTEQQLQILIQNEDGLSVKSVLIPKYSTLPVKTKKFEDLTTEENNYLVVVHGLTKIVYPIIKNEFNTQCPDHVLNEIRFSIDEKQLKGAKTRRRDGKKSRKKGIHLTPDHQKQLFSQTREESKNLDLELMIYILKKITNNEWNKGYIDQLNVIENIRREIVQSSSGIFDQTKFLDIINCIRKVVFYFGGISFKEELSRLQHIRNILE